MLNHLKRVLTVSIDNFGKPSEIRADNKEKDIKLRVGDDPRTKLELIAEAAHLKKVNAELLAALKRVIPRFELLSININGITDEIEKEILTVAKVAIANAEKEWRRKG